MTLSIKSEPDGLGYFYGSYVDTTGTTHRVDILPPMSEPRSPFSFPNAKAHPTDWIVYADGEEIARIGRREDLESALAKSLPPGT